MFAVRCCSASVRPLPAVRVDARFVHRFPVSLSFSALCVALVSCMAPPATIWNHSGFVASSSCLNRVDAPDPFALFRLFAPLIACFCDLGGTASVTATKPATPVSITRERSHFAFAHAITARIPLCRVLFRFCGCCAAGWLHHAFAGGTHRVLVPCFCACRGEAIFLFGLVAGVSFVTLRCCVPGRWRIGGCPMHWRLLAWCVRVRAPVALPRVYSLRAFAAHWRVALRWPRCPVP